ncbi:phage holin family protein [Paenibacillus sp. P2(2022)]|uniref:phage holin family protein n=1 Tax=Paenibacillus TaxID=44249 RepID=UPI00030C9615|nr:MULTISPECIES: phage holin family protein [Paenibacillus]MDG0053068.1 phage holin family protein [Paenibacillus sp. P2(2022)]NMP10549.1 hypothetical protein [Paenibacillus polymyxa]
MKNDLYQERSNIFLEIQSFRENDKSNEELKRIEKKIEYVLNETRSVYWQVLNASDQSKIKYEHEEMLKIASNFIESTNKLIEEQKVIKTKEKHIYKHPMVRGEKLMRNIASFFPFVGMSELSRYFSDFVAVPSIKLFFVLLGAVITLLFGQFTTLNWVFVSLTVAHFISRVWANRYHTPNDYIKFNRTVQIFILPYFWLFIGNVLSKFVSFDGLPDNTFYSLLLVWLVWGELKGTVDNMKVTGLPIPPFIEKLVNSQNNTNDIEPPL